MKKIIAASLDRLVEFDSQREAEAYIRAMKSKPGKVEVLDKAALESGKYRVKIRQQYNNVPLLR